MVVRQIGVLGTGNTYPFSYSAGNGRFQSAYTAAEINATPGALIYEVRVYASTVTTIPTYTNLRLRLAHTNLSPLSITGGFDTNNSTPFATCLGPSNFTPTVASNWYIFPLTTPFVYDGVSNLLIDWSYDARSTTGFYISSSSGRNRVYLNGGSYTSPTGTASNSGNYGIQFYINMGFSITTASPLSTGAVGLTYSENIVAQNGVTPYLWQGSPTYLISGSLPPGLTATPVGNDLNIAGTPTTPGTYTFTVSVNDSATPTPKNSQKQFDITVFPPPVPLPLDEDFSTDKGWALSGGWTRGSAVAYSASTPTRSEPGSDHSPSSDNFILGHNIGADYANNMASADIATSPPLNCSTATTVRLRFWRWMGASPNDTHKVQVTNNGSTWTDVWSVPTGTTLNDSAWTSVYYDISAQAAGKSVVQIRFILGPTDASTVNTGWCIDDLLVEVPGPDLEVREGAAPPGGTLITDNQAVGGLRDFGMVPVSQQSTPVTFAFTNAGPSNITFSAGIVKTGANPGDFYLQAGGFPGSLTPGQTGTFDVLFYRTSVGVSTCTLEIAHNANGSGTTPFEINLRGEAIQPVPDMQVHETNATGPLIPHQSPAATTIRDFGSQDVSAGPTAYITICVVNAGTGTMNMTAPSMGGTWWTEFTLDNTGFSNSLAAGANTSFQIAFDPTSTGVKDAVIWIPHTDSAKPSPYEIPVTGIGTSPGPMVTVTENSATGPSVPYNDPASGGRDFGNQNINAGPTAALTIFVNNPGTATLTLGNPVLGGADPGEFTLNLAGFTTSVAAAGSTSFEVAFDPTTVGQKNATVTFTHDDPNTTSPFIINVTGNGTNTSGTASVHATNGSGPILPNPAPATGILNFGNQDINSGPTAAAVIYVQNTGTSTLTLGAPVFNPATTEFQLQATGFAGTLAIGASATFSITFDPTTVGTKNAVVEFTHNDPSTASPYVLNVTGNGILNAPVIEVREGSVTGPTVASGAAAAVGGGRDCGSIDVSAGPTAPITIVILNTGTLNLNLGTPTLTGPNSGSFVLNTTGYSSPVAPAGSTSLQVTFDPSLGGIKDAQIEFSQDDGTQPTPYVVMIRGTAIDPAGVQITTTSLPAGSSGVAYGPATLTAIQGTTPYTWSLYSGSLPAGLSLSPAGVISGTPSGFGGSFQFTVRVADGSGATDEQLLTIGIAGSLTGGGRAGGGGGCATDSSGTVLWILVLLGATAAMMRLRRRKA
ncbi:MAG: choice-of-anchor D domain-containing protein [Planctomycetes bacterium]|nr:choice-of-anchor D domain-containing protein [Planctomycetota bacterium]